MCRYLYTKNLYTLFTLHMKHSLLQSTKPNETVGALNPIVLCLQYYILFYVQISKAEKSPGELYIKNRHTLITDEMTQRHKGDEYMYVHYYTCLVLCMLELFV